MQVISVKPAPVHRGYRAAPHGNGIQKRAVIQAGRPTRECLDSAEDGNSPTRAFSAVMKQDLNIDHGDCRREQNGKRVREKQKV